MRKITLHVDGRVQGVGFRYMTKMVADQLAIGGTVRNQADGSVLITASGTDEAMATFIAKVKASPSPVGKVTFFELRETPTLPDYSTFQILYS